MNTCWLSNAWCLLAVVVSQAKQWIGGRDSVVAGIGTPLAAA